MHDYCDRQTDRDRQTYTQTNRESSSSIVAHAYCVRWGSLNYLQALIIAGYVYTECCSFTYDIGSRAAIFK